MKKIIHSCKALLACSLLFMGIEGYSQQYPFPVDINYTYGIMPTNKNSADAKAAYNAWKQSYVVDITCGATPMKRVTFDDPGNSYTQGAKADVSVSEGIGYGLLLSAYHGDKTVFDGLLAYYKLNKNNNGVMNWIINLCNSTIKPNGATDADLDAAMALVVASYQWGATDPKYLADAKTLIGAIKTSEIEAGTNILKPGDAFGGSAGGNNDLVNISYFSPAYYRVFGDVTNDKTYWDGVAQKGYDILKLAMNPNTGLVPDWARGSNGASPAPGASTYQFQGAQFYYDAIRTPFRTALDYLWNGTPDALTYSKTVNAWLQSAHPNPASIGARYSLDGNKLDNSHNNTFVGNFSAVTMATDVASTGNKNYTNLIYTDNKNTNPGASQYFNASWKALSLLLQTGNFYLPPPDACDSPLLSPSYNLCSGNALMDAGIMGGTYVWKKNGAIISNATSQTYTATTAGTYEVTVTVQANGKPCVRRASAEVYQATPVANFQYSVTGLNATFTDLSDGGVKTYAWTFGTGSTPTTAAIANPVTGYNAPGLKLVTLTITNACNQTNSVTKEVTIAGSATADGWYATDFRGDINTPGQAVYISASLETGAPVGSITVDGATNCRAATTSFKTNTTQYSAVGIAFKDPVKGTGLYKDWALNIQDYPYVRFRVKVDQAVDSFRVDLLDNTYTPTSLKPVYLKGERNADGTYKPIPVNQWFIATLDFTGRFFAYSATTPKPVDATKIQQINFYPYAQYPTAVGRKNFNLYFDWVIVGNKQYPAPDLSTLNTALAVCPGALATTSIGFMGDTCTLDADDISWSNGASTPTITPNAPGKYTLTVSNYGGVATKAITISLNQNSKAGLSYTPLTTNSIQVTDGSTGPSSSYAWYRFTKKVPAPGAWATANLIGLGQNPGAFNGATYTTPYTWATGDTVCQRITSSCYKVPNDRGACVGVSFTILSLDELNESSTNVYPTLTSDNLNILLGGTLSGVFDVTITDITGVKRSESSLGTGLHSINVSEYSSGTYLVTIKQGSRSIKRRFIKQ